MKITKTTKLYKNNSKQIVINENKQVMLGTNDGWIILDDVQLEGKKRMKVKDLMNGFDFMQWSLK